MNNPDPYSNNNFDHAVFKQGGGRDNFHGHLQPDHPEAVQERAQRTAVVRRLIAALESSDD